MSPRIITALFAAGAGLALAGCFQGAKPAAMNDYGLYFQHEGGDAKLAYGLANSDDVGLMLQCAKGSGRVQVSDVARDPKRTALILASLGRQSQLNAHVQADSDSAGTILVADTRADIPALTGFRATGLMQVRAGGFGYDITANPAERVAVARFFAACGQGA